MGEDGESREGERDRASERGNGVNDASGLSDENAAALYSLDRAIRGGRGGFYFLIASPRTQTETIKRYAGENIGVYNFSGENRELVEISNLLDREPGRRAYVFLNFHLALQKKDKAPVSQDGKLDIWDIDAVRRLNFSRNGLAKRGRTLIFCMTQEADDLLNRRAYDFYDYVKLFFRLEDQADTADQTIQTARPEDRSIGVDVKVDFSLPEEELLAFAITLGHEADELRQKARYADALYLYKKQCEIRERILGMEHLDTARSYTNIGLAYFSQDDYKKALKWLQKARNINLKILGSEHPETKNIHQWIDDAQWRRWRLFIW